MKTSRARKPTRLKLSEANVTKLCVDFAFTRGYRAERRNAGVADFGVRGKVTYGKPGASDYIFTHPALAAFYCEFKASNKKVRELRDLTVLHLRNPENKAIEREFKQALYLFERRREGFTAFWASSLEMFKKGIEG